MLRIAALRSVKLATRPARAGLLGQLHSTAQAPEATQAIPIQTPLASPKTSPATHTPQTATSTAIPVASAPATHLNTEPVSSAPPPPPPPPPGSKPSSKRKTFARAVLAAVLGSAGFIVIHQYRARHPAAQLDHDPTLPTVVVVGNGWGSTAFLKQLDNQGYNVIVVSPTNYFLFTPLLPSVTVGTLAARSILEPTRFLTRHLKRKVAFYEAAVTSVDPVNKVVTFVDSSPIKGQVTENEVAYDYLVYSVGAENNTFGIKGVKEHACFLKEVGDAQKVRNRLMDCVETATFAGQSEEEIRRLLSFVVVGGGPTGVEYAGELSDFVRDDLLNWYPELKDKVKITLIEALPNVLPMFSKQLIDYTKQTFNENQIDLATKTMVSEVTDKKIFAKNAAKETVEYPYGLLVWATGNTARAVTKDLMARLGPAQDSRRGLLVDGHLRVLGAEGVFALGDCTATTYAPTAQCASQQGSYLSKVFAQLAKKQALVAELEGAKRGGADPARLDALANAVIRASNVRPFHYSHQGSLAYIGSDKAIADLPFGGGNLAAAGLATYYFWRSAYLSQLFSLRNRILVASDWAKCKVLGRDVSRE